MLRYSVWMASCLISFGLFASTDTAEDSQDPIQCYKAKIVQGVSQALSKNVKVSSQANRSSSSKHQSKQKTCGHTKPKSDCCTAKVITSDDINPHGFVIDEPGVYRLEDDVVFHSKRTGAVAIVIDANNVTLDLCEKTLQQKNSTSGTIGILVNARENVVVENGTVKGFTMFGIRANAETSYLTLQSLTVLENGTNDPGSLLLSAGIVINSGVPSAVSHDIAIRNVTSSGNVFAGLVLSGVRNVDVLESRFNNNSSATTGYGTNAFGIVATSFYLGQPGTFLPCTDINIFDCVTNSNNGVGGSVGIEILSVPQFGFQLNTNVTIERCVANHNIGGGDPNAVNEGEGFVVTGTQNFAIRDCVAMGNGTAATHPSGIAGFFASSGFSVPFSGFDGIIENCYAEGNSGAGDSSQGFRVTRSSNITISNCIAIGNNNPSTGEAWGFTTDTNLGNDAGEFGAPVNTNFVIQNCVAEANNAQSSICGGFKFVSQVNSILADCRSVGHGIAGSNNGYGILVTDPACCSNTSCCTLDPVVCNSPSGCLPVATCCPTLHNIIHNNEVVGNTFYGIFDNFNPVSNNAKNAYYANVARGNGTNYALPNGAPIRIWGPPPAFPSTTDNNGVLDAQLDNIDIRP